MDGAHRGDGFTVVLLNGGRSSDPGQWSGIPHSVAAALGDLGARVVALEAPFPAPLQRLVDGHISVRHRALDLAGPLLGRQLRRLPHVGGVVALGSGEQLIETSGPLVTYDDMTVAQAVEIAHPGPAALGERGTRRWRARQQRALRSATVCGAFSGWVVDSLVADYEIPRIRARVLGWGQNHLNAPPAARTWEQPRLLFVGIDWRRKNGDGVVRAFRRLREQQPAATLDVVGGHPPLDVEHVTGHGLLRLDRADERARLLRLYAAATCFVMPSWHEPGGIVYAEAGAAGLPLIATSAGGAGEFVRPDCGVLVDPGDDDALLAAMVRLSDPATAGTLGAAARKRSSLFTWPAVAERMLRGLGAPEWLGRPWAAFLDA